MRKCVWGHLAACVMACLLLNGAARATENGGSVYPLGAETVLQGMTPAPRSTVFGWFTDYYSANEFDNSSGKSSVPEFKVRAFANAVKISHNWGVPVLGGMLGSNIAVPVVYEQLHVAPGKYNKFGLSNVDLEFLVLGYNKGHWHWYYEGDFFLPGATYNSADVVNTGQHNTGTGPVAAVTYLSKQWEISSKVDYVVNFKDGDTKYQSGNELFSEYSALRSLSKKAAIGVNGYFYKQTTDDRQFAKPVGDGNRGRNLAIGPQARIFFGSGGALALKYTRDTLVENRARGNSFWFQFGVPLSFGKGK